MTENVDTTDTYPLASLSEYDIAPDLEILIDRLQRYDRAVIDGLAFTAEAEQSLDAKARGGYTGALILTVTDPDGAQRRFRLEVDEITAEENA